MSLVFDMINPLYLFIAGGVFLIILGCACYGCHDLFYSQAEAAGGVIACDASDCDNPEIHEQHLNDNATKGPEGQQAWGMDSHAQMGECPAGIGVFMGGDFCPLG